MIINYSEDPHFGKEGLPYRNVLAVTEDQTGNIWMGTSKGLLCYHANTRRIIGYFHSLRTGWSSNEGINQTMRSVQQITSGISGLNQEGSVLRWNKMIQHPIPL
jgi:ligand-binding sensor domain-containing protein